MSGKIIYTTPTTSQTVHLTVTKLTSEFLFLEMETLRIIRDLDLLLHRGVLHRKTFE